LNMPEQPNFSSQGTWPESSAHGTNSKRNLRAQERVMEYLQEQFQKLNLAAGARLPTSRQLAKQLHVSVSTVQTVFRKLASDGIIRSQVGNGSFLALPPSKAPSPLRIGISFGVTDETDPSQIWQIAIAGAVLKHCATLNKQLSVVPVNLKQHTIQETMKGLHDLDGQIQGLIHRVSPLLENNAERLYKLGFPVVLLNPPSFAATSNFVSTDFAECGQCVARAFLASGRKRIAVLDSHPDQRFSIPTALRQAGMVREFGFRCNEKFDFRVFKTEGHNEQAGYDSAAKLFAEGGYRPDAIYCSGDFLAAGVLRFCREVKVRIPQEVSLIGGTGAMTHPAEFSEITRVGQPVNDIGRELLSMVVELSENQNRPLPARLLPPTVLIGKTTLPSENKALGSHSYQKISADLAHGEHAPSQAEG